MNDRELLTAALEAANRHDLDAVVALTADDFEGVIPSSMSAEPDVYSGHEGIRRYFESFWDVVDDLVWEIEHFEDADGWTIALGRASGTGRTSGLQIDNPVVIAYTTREDRLHRIHAYPDMTEARRAIAS